MAKFILGSSSKVRLDLLKQINFVPDIIYAPNIDEKPIKKEKPLDYVKRIAEEKADSLHQKFYGDVILSADTIVSTQIKIIQKPKDNDEIKKLLKYYSSKNIKLITSICIITSDHKKIKKTITTKIKFKNLNQQDIEEYINGDYGSGKAGGIAIESLMESFIIKMVGSYSNIMGLPLYETRNALISAGIKAKK